ncbi:DNA-binding MarR family transcriptional regulator [Saccharothrix tamanrassetensis]|uniref:DNA-binding MarR family transcriptional regulator n=1 Tax=Saccharothrix tamanrassetensis TaxID=1051531 RepID=A0A841C9A2_9PSEU|nr:MarR family transcriptional regulator [Saccharothrix tamanrassetensis]MBB5953513.1 DNA-binding MarR family transcriptional regulator [Saccharothrix tamanrassetensis]
METRGAPARLRGTPSWLLNQTATVAQRLVADGFGAEGARRYHYSLLATLEEFGPTSQAELGRRGGVDRSDVVATVNELSERGFVERSPDPGDRRRNVVTLTEAGTAHLRHLDEVLARAQEALLAALPRKDREQLVRLLNQVLEHHS